ncbi:high affinity cAMP-specific and IBMX-insensitive 3',5'-cyclic phosphodiesterase 8A-like isoform X2 [Dysidea avara]|uniref:high affinity cAMP-specific and IBMX-insensitive 3',5'-cyclic phosphodiesterase 8A-like isoform X2 n=1 Tax=Dysidea avara TaxID=196820 RepID=UPI003328FF10
MHNGEVESAPYYRRPTDIFSKENVMQRIPRMNLGQPHMKLLVQSRNSGLAKRLTQAGYSCEASQNTSNSLELLAKKHHQVLIVDALSSDMNPEEVARELHSKSYGDAVVLMAIVDPSVLKKSDHIKKLSQLGYSRVISDSTFLESELHLLESNELTLNNRLQFAEALFEVAEYSTDAVEISIIHPGSECRSLYTNRSFNWTHEEETEGRQSTEGEAKRKHSKQIVTVHNPYQDVIYEVSLRPCYHQDGWHHPSRTSSCEYCGPLSIGSFNSPTHLVSSRPGHGSLGSLSQTRTVVETPIMKVINMLQIAQNTDECSVEVKDTLETTMEILKKVPDIYAPNLEENEPSNQGTLATGGFVYRGLLKNPRRQSQNFDSLTRGTSLHSQPTSKLYCLATPSQIRKALDNLKTWKYNIMELEAVSFNQPLYYLGMEVFVRWFGVDKCLGVEESVVGSWLQLMESRYHRSNTYHNSTHAADVLQAGAYFLQKLIDRGDVWDPLDIASVLIAMVVHDLDHPGRTNHFLSNSQHELSLLYNDKSILENHHVATAFKETTRSSASNIFKHLEAEAYQTMRQNIVEMVLATDMSKHFEHLSKFTTGVTSQSSGDFTSASTTSLDKDQTDMDLLVKRVLVKTADLGNPARPMPMCKEWALRISKEYFSQTDEERKMGLPIVMPAFDRNTCNFPQTQVQFIDFIVTGLFEAWNNYVDISEVVSELESNYKFWKDCPAAPSPAEM